MRQQQEKKVIKTVKQLLAQAHNPEEMNGLILLNILTECKQMPTADNGWTAMFHCGVHFIDPTNERKHVFTAHGDANPHNVEGNLPPYRMAETRAVARALRWATNNGDAVEEEMGGGGQYATQSQNFTVRGSQEQQSVSTRQAQTSAQAVVEGAGLNSEALKEAEKQKVIQLASFMGLPLYNQQTEKFSSTALIRAGRLFVSEKWPPGPYTLGHWLQLSAGMETAVNRVCKQFGEWQEFLIHLRDRYNLKPEQGLLHVSEEDWPKLRQFFGGDREGVAI